MHGKKLQCLQAKVEKHNANIFRWQQSGNTFKASIEKAEWESLDMQQSIVKTRMQRASVIHRITRGIRLYILEIVQRQPDQTL